MPWSNQGGGQGGPWQPKNPGPGGQGPKNQGPWGKGPQGNGSPPDIEDLLRRGQERLRRVMPGGSSGGLGGFGLGLLLAIGALIWALTGFYTVRTDEIGMNLVFGKFDSKTTPGLRYNWPYPVGGVIKVPVTAVNSMQIGANSADTRLSSRGRDDSLMLTGDERIVDIDFTVFWQVKGDQPEKFVFNLKDPRTTIEAVAQAAMREIVGRSQLKQIVSGSGSRSQVEADVRTLMQRVLNDYDAGVNITNVNVRNLDVPQPVVDSFRDINAAGQDASQTITQALTYESQIIPKANGEASQVLREAEGYRIATVDQARGQTARFTKVLQEYQKAPDVTRERLYLETMERVFGGMDKIILDQKGGNGVLPYLPLNEPRAPRPGVAGRVQ